MTTTFSFATTDCKYSKKIDENIVLNLYRTTHAVAILHFTDEMRNRINIPPGLKVYTEHYQTGKIVLQKPIEEIYALCWSDDYQIEYNNTVVLNIKTNRTWDITSS
jgi:plasmid replication initiation protein